MVTASNIRRGSVAACLLLALLLALVVAPSSASAHPELLPSEEEAEGLGVEIVDSGDLNGFFPAFQWAGTPAVDDETAEFVYAGSGCTPANYVADDFAGKIALVDDAARSEDPSDPCPIATFFQKVQSAEKAGAIGFVQVPAEEGRSNATAITADIPALEVKVRTAEAVAVLDAVKAGDPVTAVLTDKTEPILSMSDVACKQGKAGPFACDGVDLLSLTAAHEFNSAGISDLWGWTDRDDEGAPVGEYVIMGKTNGVAFFRITDPTNPEYLGELPNPGLTHETWHDIKVYADHAFIVSESEGHGMTVFDLTRLRDQGPVEDGATREWDMDASYKLTTAAHNLEINEEIGMAYVLGGNGGIVAPDQCLSGLHMVDINDPKNPTFAGCYALEGGPGTAARTVGSPATEVSPAAYVHDAQCVVYHGPDDEHDGKHICVTAAENKVVVADVTNPLVPVTLGTTDYEHVAYTHQGWFDETQSFWFVNDELDEQNHEEVVNTRTVVLDLRDLDDPKPHLYYSHKKTEAITHNNYVVGDRLFQSNYAAGLRVANIKHVAEGKVHEAAYFDTYPTNDDTNFDGTWSNYPFFESGTIAVSGRQEGLFLLRLSEDAPKGGNGGANSPAASAGAGDHAHTADVEPTQNIDGEAPRPGSDAAASEAGDREVHQAAAGDATAVLAARSAVPASGGPAVATAAMLMLALSLVIRSTVRRRLTR